MAKKKYDWVCVYNSKEGHRFFLNRNGNGLAIADQSGYYPHETDDGVLFCDLSQPVILGETKDFARHITIAVRKEEDPFETGYTCSLTLDEALWLLKEYNLPLHVRPLEGKERVVKLVERF